jgi:hypothetical protein
MKNLLWLNHPSKNDFNPDYQIFYANSLHSALDILFQQSIDLIISGLDPEKHLHFISFIHQHRILVPTIVIPHPLQTPSLSDLKNSLLASEFEDFFPTSHLSIEDLHQ